MPFPETPRQLVIGRPYHLSNEGWQRELQLWIFVERRALRFTQDLISYPPYHFTSSFHLIRKANAPDLKFIS
ncbi:MAG: hypothetical protein DMG93_14235 [Acidobacteria bacterium]|nr:MAG: hypothetical protein DMG93_14235 [Acidobacteriota bacterium]